MAGRLSLTPCQVATVYDHFTGDYSAVVTLVPAYAVEGANNVLLDAVVVYDSEENLGIAWQWYTIDPSQPNVEDMLVDPVGAEWSYQSAGMLAPRGRPVVRIRAIDRQPNPAYAYALAHKGLAGAGAFGHVEAYAYLFD